MQESVSKLLVANRGEIAVRIMRTAANLGVNTVAIYATDDSDCLHVARADESSALREAGPAAYLNVEAIIQLALSTGCDALHPGYGFLSENTELAEACQKNGIVFVGPSADTLSRFGDKGEARQIAEQSGVPVLKGTNQATTLDQALHFFDELAGGSMIIKAVAGGGGRGVRVVNDRSGIEAAFKRCSREAQKAFGNDALYVEEYLPHARHVEVQIVGDSHGAVLQLGDRDCSLQRRHQKVIEIAPAPSLDPVLRKSMQHAAVQLARAVNYQGVGTIEFLVDSENDRFVFIEANARLQVEHTVTEEVIGVDLVETQLRIAAGQSVTELTLERRLPKGMAVQLRINGETMTTDGATRPASGSIRVFNPPAGPGIRLDTSAYPGYASNPGYDSLIGKLIVHSSEDDFSRLCDQAYNALCQFQVEGLETNINFLQNLLQEVDVKKARFHTRFIDETIARLAEPGTHPRRYFEMEHRAEPHAVVPSNDVGPGDVVSPIQGTVVEICRSVGDEVREGDVLMILDAMKMEHEIAAAQSGVIENIEVCQHQSVRAGELLLIVSVRVLDNSSESGEVQLPDPDYVRPDLSEVQERRATTLDENRPGAIEKRHASGRRSARENIEDICDDGSFVEYGQLALAAQRRRRTIEELVARSPADGMVTGIGAVNGELFADDNSRCVVMSYDYTVFAGTQGMQNHEKTDRMIKLARQEQLPVVLIAEGGGGRPGDTDNMTHDATMTFADFASLSGTVPMIGLTTGRCFAGNAALLGCCDVIIATEGSNIGMGGPAMVEGGGLGVVRPEDIGPLSVQVANGVVDVPVKDEAEAVSTAKRYLSYFQGAVNEWEAPDQIEMRGIIPENRLRVYDIRRVIEVLADAGSVLEIRAGFGKGMVTSFIRVEGRPLGVVANNPAHLGGAIDSDGADKAVRFMKLCDAFNLPLLFLCDTPGIMVGPEVEKTALVRHASRMFQAGANLTVPCFTIVLRKAYGLGALAMAGGSYKLPFFTVSWPTGEYGGMGIEGSISLGYRHELAAIEDPEERDQRYQSMVDAAYERGKALNFASLFILDDVIDPADSRFWVSSSLKSVRHQPRGANKHAYVDAW